MAGYRRDDLDVMVTAFLGGAKHLSPVYRRCMPSEMTISLCNGSDGTLRQFGDTGPGIENSLYCAESGPRWKNDEDVIRFDLKTTHLVKVFPPSVSVVGKCQPGVQFSLGAAISEDWWTVPPN